MSDAVLASIIAAIATLLTSFLQLRLSVGKELAAARGQGIGGKRKGRAPMVILFVMLVAAAVGGFALSRWLADSERAEQITVERDLRAQVDQITRTANQLELTRAGVRAEVEADVLRGIGSDGVVVTATVSPCRPALVVNPPGTTPAPSVSADAAPAPTLPCTESEANTVSLCATIPARATVTEIQLYSRFAESEDAWSANRLTPGQEAGQARFATQSVEKPDAPGTKQVCQAYSLWSTEHPRVARMVVRYTL